MDLKVRMNVPLGYKIKGCQDISIIIGNDDDVVDPIETFDWLVINNPKTNVRMINGMGHRFNINTFINIVDPILPKII